MDRLIQYFAEHGSITPVDALNDLGIMRLAPRIHVLKKLGYKITSKLESGVNRYGDSVRFARYEAEDVEQFRKKNAEDSQKRSITPDNANKSGEFGQICPV